MALPISVDTKQVKQQKFRERRYPIKSFKVPNNKVSAVLHIVRIPPSFPIKNRPPSCGLHCPPPKWLQNIPHHCSSKSHKYDKHDKVPCRVSSYHWSHKANLKLTCYPKLNSPALDHKSPMQTSPSVNLPPKTCLPSAMKNL